ncbi:hypothetical protein TRVL_09972 [Trypanosoma vivax]|nr:hypothetical protein TRVL_09972 [Trypanosoma vivax]
MRPWRAYLHFVFAPNAKIAKTATDRANRETRLNPRSPPSRRFRSHRRKAPHQHQDPTHTITRDESVAKSPGKTEPTGLRRQPTDSGKARKNLTKRNGLSKSIRTPHVSGHTPQRRGADFMKSRGGLWFAEAKPRSATQIPTGPQKGQGPKTPEMAGRANLNCQLLQSGLGTL